MFDRPEECPVGKGAERAADGAAVAIRRRAAAAYTAAWTLDVDECSEAHEGEPEYAEAASPASREGGAVGVEGERKKLVV